MWRGSKWLDRTLLAIQDHEPIRGARLMFWFSIYSRVGVGALIAVFVWSAPVDLRARDRSKDWIVLKDCRLIPNPADDLKRVSGIGDKKYAQIRPFFQ